MSAEEVVGSGVGRFRGFGHSHETQPDEVSNDPTLKRMILEINANTEAQRLRTEAEMDTPENRREAAKVAAAELAKKRRGWESRAWALPFDGFKGIPDSAEDRELRIYTRTYDHKHKFWGVKPVGMAIWDFWNIYDPEVTRYDDANQETPATPETSMPAISQTDSTQRIKSTPKPRRRQKTPNINPTHRARKSTTPPSKVNKNTRKSLAHKIDSGNSELGYQIRGVDVAVRASGRPARTKAAVTAPGPEQKSAKAKPAVRENTSSQVSQPKRPRGRPPTKGKSTERPSNQKKTPLAKGSARVTKSSQKEPRPSAPSTHKMRTRRAGPAEPLQLP